MPIDIDVKNQEAVFKVFEVKDGQPYEVDIFSLKLNESYQFLHDNIRYNFTLEEIKRWRGMLTKFAAFYKLDISN